MLFWRGSNCKGNPLMPCLSISDSASAPDVSSTFRRVFRLPMRLPPRDSSSASRPVLRATSHYGPVFRLPSCSIPWLLRLPPPSRNIPQCLARSARHPPLGICRTATPSAVPLHVPATLLAFRRSAASSGCTTASPTAPLSRPVT